MANIVLITAALVGFYSMATEARVQYIDVGVSLCDYKKTPEDCATFGECLTEAGYTVSDPCDDQEIFDTSINLTSWPQIRICNWKKTVPIKEDGSCDTELEKDYIESTMTFEDPKTKTAFIAAVDKCNEDDPYDCIAALLCVSKQAWKICHPNGMLLWEIKSED